MKKHFAFAACAFLLLASSQVFGEENHPCREEAKKLCGDVKPGEGRIMDCMKQHESSLSDSCKAMMKQKMEHNPCQEDVKRLCGDVKPGEGRIIKCLNEHESSLSPACKEMKQKKSHEKGDQNKPQH